MFDEFGLRRDVPITVYDLNLNRGLAKVIVSTLIAYVYVDVYWISLYSFNKSLHSIF